ncbi:MAG: hypothetical protein LBK01_04285 [Burkholderiaceae bacterium]|nr:hypothetical protein [Burkholderiaceae bacterium]
MNKRARTMHPKQENETRQKTRRAAETGHTAYAAGGRLAVGVSLLLLLSACGSDGGKSAGSPSKAGSDIPCHQASPADQASGCTGSTKVAQGDEQWRTVTVLETASSEKAGASE